MRRWLLVLLCAAFPAQAADAPHLALIIGNDAYRSLPPIPACQASASVVAAALRRAGWSVTELRDPSNGQMGAAIGSFGDALADTPGAAAFVYECGYAADYERRLFLLPTSASLARDTDVLTAGLVAPALTGPVARSKVQAGFVALDLISLPGAAAIQADTAQLRAAAPRTGILAASSAAAGPAAPTPLATALAAALGQPTLTVAELQATLQQALAGRPGLDVLAQAPAEPALLQGDPPAPAPAPVAAPEPPKLEPPRPEPVLPPASPPEPPPPQAPIAAPPAPDEVANLGDLDRRRVQLALQRLGYYAGKVDGTVGPETLAAIRRYQHELGADMTGRLTQTQAARLLAQP